MQLSTFRDTVEVPLSVTYLVHGDFDRVLRHLVVDGLALGQRGWENSGGATLLWAEHARWRTDFSFYRWLQGAWKELCNWGARPGLRVGPGRRPLAWLGGSRCRVHLRVDGIVFLQGGIVGNLLRVDRGISFLQRPPGSTWLRVILFGRGEDHLHRLVCGIWGASREEKMKELRVSQHTARRSPRGGEITQQLDCVHWDKPPKQGEWYCRLRQRIFLH